MTDVLWMGVRPGPAYTRILIQETHQTMLKARLPEVPQHPRALETLAEGVALWCGRPLYVDDVRTLRLRWVPVVPSYRGAQSRVQEEAQQMEYIAFDAHKHYTVASVERPTGEVLRETRLAHHRGAIRDFLEQWTPGSPVAVETVGNWYWLVDEIEEAGMVPRLVHARKAKVMSGMINKTDKLDARGLNRLQRTGTLPTVWIPPAGVRDQRDLPRTRMVLVSARTRLRNRIHATLAKYGLTVTGVSDLFGIEGHKLLADKIRRLPPHTRYATHQLLEHLDLLDEQVADLEERIRDVFTTTPAFEWLRTMPGVGDILGVVILTEVGDVRRFPDAEHLATYAGTTPRVHSSGGKTRFGPTRPDVNRYLKWAFREAAEACCQHRERPHWQHRHVSRLYARVRRRKDHPKAIGAVARHLAEATYWILTKEVPYQEPTCKADASTKA